MFLNLNFKSTHSVRGTRSPVTVKIGLLHFFIEISEKEVKATFEIRLMAEPVSHNALTVNLLPIIICSTGNLKTLGEKTLKIL